MFTIDVLPAERGDCLWLTYGTPDDQHHLLIDAGPQETIPTLVPELERRIHAVPGRTIRVELFIITHIDADHIQGVISLLSGPERVALFRDIWFNGYEHLGAGLLGGPDAERLTGLLRTNPTHWNHAFGGDAVVVPDDGPLPVIELRGGMRLTVLGPTHADLARLAPEWAAACRRAGIEPGGGHPIIPASWQRDELLGGGFDPDTLAAARFSADRSAANGSCISVIAEYDNRRVLLLGDALPSTIIPALDRLGEGPHEFAAVKLAHHGSRRNTNLQLLKRIRSSRWIVSSNGAKFRHPDAECLARVIVTQRKPKPTFFLNYVSKDSDGGYVSPGAGDLIENAGARFLVKLPKKRRDGTFAQGISVEL
jgi:hypothetical protein